MAKKQNFKNRYSKFVEYHTGKVHYKFQAPNMFAVHMNVPFVKFQYRDLKVLRILYLQANPDFQKITTQARNNIFSCGFLHLLHLNKLFRNNSTCFLTPRPPCGLNCQLWFSKPFTRVFKPKYVELMWILSREHVWLSEKNWKGLNNAILLHNYGSTINSNYINTQERNATAQIRGCFVDPCIYLLSKCGLFIWFSIFSAWLYPYFSNI